MAEMETVALSAVPLMVQLLWDGEPISESVPVRFEPCYVVERNRLGLRNERWVYFVSGTQRRANGWRVIGPEGRTVADGFLDCAYEIPFWGQPSFKPHGVVVEFLGHETTYTWHEGEFTVTEPPEASRMGLRR